jgi:2-keto-4-pentenoate hydratase
MPPKEVVEMTSDKHSALASSLAEAARTHLPIDPIAGLLPEQSIADAYLVQEAGTNMALAAGRRLVGRKIGLTSLAVQKQLGVDQPDYGMLFADMEVSEDGAVPAGTLIQPKVELEMAFILKHNLTQGDTTLPEVLAAIDWVVPALEIVDSRIANWKISICDTIADNASSGLYVLGGAARRVDEVDLRLAGGVLEKNGEPLSFGTGAACLGNPLNAVKWLAQVMARAGRPLQSGDVVLSGAFGPMLPAAPGDVFEGRIDGLGRVGVRFGQA